MCKLREITQKINKPPKGFMLSLWWFAAIYTAMKSTQNNNVPYNSNFIIKM